MVKSFLFTPTPSIIFGPGKRKELPAVIQKFGSRILVLTGASSLGKSAQGQQLLTDIEENSQSFKTESVNSEPTPELVDSIVKKYQYSMFDAVVAIGGGSVLDAGKAVSAMLGKSDSVVEYLEGVGTKLPDGSKIPFIAIPTTSGTGSEATKNAVISRIGQNGFKRSLRHDNYIPDVALVDAELTLNCPKETTAASGLDAFTQLLEAYVSVKSTDFIDLFAYEGIVHVIKNLKTCWANGDNLEARTSMSYAALLSGIALANSGLGTVHGFASSVGSFYAVPHGVVCGTLMAECVKVNIEKLSKAKTQAYYKYARVGRLTTGSSEKSDEYYCSSLIEFISKLTDEMQIPALSKYGAVKEDIAQIVAVTENKNNPVTLSPEDMSYILEKRL